MKKYEYLLSNDYSTAMENVANITSTSTIYIQNLTIHTKYVINIILI